MKLINGKYYWIRFKNCGGEITIGQYEEDSSYHWQIVGSDEMYKNEEIEVIKKVKE